MGKTSLVPALRQPGEFRPERLDPGPAVGQFLLGGGRRRAMAEEFILDIGQRALERFYLPLALQQTVDLGIGRMKSDAVCGEHVALGADHDLPPPKRLRCRQRNRRGRRCPHPPEPLLHSRAGTGIPRGHQLPDGAATDGDPAGLLRTRKPRPHHGELPWW